MNWICAGLMTSKNVVTNIQSNSIPSFNFNSCLLMAINNYAVSVDDQGQKWSLLTYVYLSYQQSFNIVIKIRKSYHRLWLQSYPQSTDSLRGRAVSARRVATKCQRGGHQGCHCPSCTMWCRKPRTDQSDSSIFDSSTLMISFLVTNHRQMEFA